jgi:hypothetical protein
MYAYYVHRRLTTKDLAVAIFASLFGVCMIVMIILDYVFYKMQEKTLLKKRKEKL